MTKLIELHRSYSAPGCSNAQTWVQVDRPSIPRAVLPQDSYDWLKPSSQDTFDLWEGATEHPVPDNGVISKEPLKPLPEPIVNLIARKQEDLHANYPGRHIVADVPPSDEGSSNS